MILDNADWKPVRYFFATFENIFFVCLWVYCVGLVGWYIGARVCKFRLKKGLNDFSSNLYNGAFIILLYVLYNNIIDFIND